jgi:hypothetical protein
VSVTPANGVVQEPFVGSTPFWVMIGGIIAAALCCIFIVAVLLAIRRVRQKERDRAPPAVEDADVGAKMTPLKPRYSSAELKGIVDRLVAVEDVSSTTDLGDAPSSEAPDVRTTAFLGDGEYEDESDGGGAVAARGRNGRAAAAAAAAASSSSSEGGTVEVRIRPVMDEGTLQRATIANVIEITESDEENDADARRVSAVIVPVHTGFDFDDDDDDSDNAVITISRVGSIEPVRASQRHRSSKKSRKSRK